MSTFIEERGVWAPETVDEYQDRPPARTNLDQLSGDADLLDIYLEQIGKIPLLNAEQEVNLAQRMEVGALAAEAQGLRDADDREDFLANLTARTAAAYNKRFEVTKHPENEAGAAKETAAAVDLVIRLAADETVADAELCQLAAEGAQAKSHMINANLRLVASMAKKYRGRGLDYLDLIEAGNSGLMHGVEKFDYAKGYKLSTYAAWWIRKSIMAAIADQSRTIRLPVKKHQKMVRIGVAHQELAMELERTPTDEEVAKRADVSPKIMRELSDVDYTFSFEKPVGHSYYNGEPQTLGDILTEGHDTVVLEAMGRLTVEKIQDIMGKILSKRELTVVSMRHGFDDGKEKGSTEIAKTLGLSTSTISQTWRNAKTKLARSEALRDLL